jgi:hypothetical protein
MLTPKFHCNYVFTVIDRTSKGMEAVPLLDISAVACAQALIFSWISLFGVPKTITSDCAPQFTSNVWSQLCKMLNITHRQTTAYHPEANCAVERLHYCLKDALRARTATATWAKELLWVLLGLPAQPREDTGLSLAEAVFGTPIFLPNEFLHGEEISVDNISKVFFKLWMLLLFLSLASIIRVACFLRSCQLTSSAPPSSGCAEAASTPLSSAPTMAPMLSCTGDPAPLPSEAGRGMRSSPSTA